MKADSKNVIFILKTMNFKHDQRVHKEVFLLKSQGIKSSFIVKSVDEIINSEFIDYNFIKKIKWKEKERATTSLQYIFDIYFQVSSFLYLIKSGFSDKSISKEESILWICDPVMFPMVLLARFSGYKVIWDNHELPPKKFLASKLFTKVFKLAYESANVCIHANKERLKYLEELLRVEDKKTLVMSNLPNSIELKEVRPNSLSDSFDEELPFIYLQNSYSHERCGHEIFQAMKDLDVNIVCSGSFSKVDQKSLIDDFGFSQNRLYNIGFISQKEINWCLSNCLGTIILYRNTSLNQWFCDPNRLYQAMVIGTSIITASNPTIISTLQQYDYKNVIVLEGDGSSVVDIRKSIVLLEDKMLIKQPLKSINLWSDYNAKLASIINKI